MSQAPSSGSEETKSFGWTWPRREHLGQSVKQLLRLGLAQLRTLRQSLCQAKLGRRLSQPALVRKAQLASKPVRPHWNTCKSAVLLLTQLSGSLPIQIFFKSAWCKIASGAVKTFALSSVCILLLQYVGDLPKGWSGQFIHALRPTLTPPPPLPSCSPRSPCPQAPQRSLSEPLTSRMYWQTLVSIAGLCKLFNKH